MKPTSSDKIPTTSASALSQVATLQKHLPHGITVQERGGMLRMTRPTRSSAMTQPLVVGAIFSDVGLYLGITSGDAPLWGLLAVGVASVLLTYNALAMLLGRTTYEVSRGQMRIRTWPFPMLRDGELRTRDLWRVVVELDSDEDAPAMWTIWYVKPDGHRERLVRGLTREDEANLIKDVLDGFLGVLPASRNQ